MTKPANGEKRRSSSGRPRSKKPRPGLPDPASVLSEKTFASPAGRSYRILRTSERDVYDAPAKTESKPRGSSGKRKQ